MPADATPVVPADATPVVPADAVLVASGRQALNLVAQELRARGVRVLLAPGYFCTTMLLPFQLEGIRVRTLPVDDTCLLEPRALAAALDVSGTPISGHAGGPRRPGSPPQARRVPGPGDAAGVAVLHAETFGTRARPPLAALLAAARAAGVPVVVDQTHTLLADPVVPASHPGVGPAGGVAADYRVASLRKLLPVPEGGWVTGLATRPALTRRAVDEEVTRLRLAGEDEKAELVMDDAFEPGALAVRTYDELRALDVPALVREREANETALRALLAELRLPIVNAAGSRCCVVVRHPAAAHARARLAGCGVHSPVYWPRPPGLSPGAPWPADLLCLPVDQHLPGPAQQVLAALARPRGRS